jgi:hypothetical protein
MTIKEIKQELINRGVDEKFLSGNKKDLQEMLEKMEPIQSIFDNIEEEIDNSCLQVECEKDIIPRYGSPLWSNYVFSKFEKDELKDGFPTCDGCRRVLEEVLGTIVSSTITNIICPTKENNGTTIVSVRLDIMVHNEDHRFCDRLITCEEIADVSSKNCDAPYDKYPSSIASTRAEGRAIRKLLRLKNIITAEEKSNIAETAVEDDWSIEEELITDSQLNVFDMMCGPQRLNMNVIDFINYCGENHEEPYNITRSSAQKILQRMNKIQTGQEKRPEIGEYLTGWKEEALQREN